MKSLKWQVKLGIILLLSSICIYTIHFFIFREPQYLFRILGAQLGFLPINVFLVTVVISLILKKIKKHNTLQKLNMIVGAFFSEVGTELIRYFYRFDKTYNQIQKNLIVTDTWTDTDFTKAQKQIREFDFQIDSKMGNLEDLHRFLSEKRNFFLSLFENPNLQEHGSFSNLFRAVFHLEEELKHREHLEELSRIDCEHLSGDIQRAYGLLICEWLGYMKHLKDNYPFLFSLALRTNPFDPNASAEIKS
ncbi:MAG: hypothetical protein JW786_04205 [Desulfobacterales bacterium]|nr:hypothetical protein [Desulfobacterales bacterium]